MDKLVLFDNSIINNLLNTRLGETKFGEHINTLTYVSNIYDSLKNLDVKYVIFGLPEAVGVFANHGKSGTSTAWEATIKVLLNIQSNTFTQAKNVLVLGHLDFTEEQKQLSKLNQDDPKHIAKSRKLTITI